MMYKSGWANETTDVTKLVRSGNLYSWENHDSGTAMATIEEGPQVEEGNRKERRTKAAIARRSGKKVSVA